MIKFEPAIAAIQHHARTNIIVVTIQTPPEGNPWLNTLALFSIAERVGPERLCFTCISDIHETLTEKIVQTWHIPLGNLVLHLPIEK